MFIENEEIFIAWDEIIRRYEDVIPKMDTNYVTKKGQKSSLECIYDFIVYFFKHLYFTKTKKELMDISELYMDRCVDIVTDMARHLPHIEVYTSLLLAFPLDMLKKESE